MKFKSPIRSLFIFVLLAGGVERAAAQYCIPEFENSCSSGSSINKFIFNTLNNSGTGCNGNANNYILYPAEGSTTTSVELGGSYNLSVKSIGKDGFGVWIDYNNDQDFDDAGEFVYSSPFYDNILFSGMVTIPNNAAFIGERRLRVRGVDQTLVYNNHSCTSFSKGETEDYIITINPAPPCTGTPVAGTIKAFPSSICAAGNSSELNLSGYTVASDIAIQWEKSSNGSDWTAIAGATSEKWNTLPLNSTTYYRTKVTCTNSGLFAYSNQIKVVIGEVKILSVINDSLCGGGVANLQVLSNANTVSWYQSESSTLPLYSSNFPFKYSPDVTETTTFYAVASSGIMYIDSVGKPNNTSGSGSDAYQNNYLVFNTLHACKLSGVHVYPSAEGIVIIQLRDKNFVPLKTDTFTIDSSQINQKTFLELNYNLNPGNGFQLTLMEGSVPLWSNQSGVAFPYEIPNVISLYTSNLGPNYYFYFYNWLINFTDQCETPPAPVTAFVSNAPAVDIVATPSNATICANDSPGVVLNATSGYTNYTWLPATGLSATSGSQVTALPDVTTTYTLVASDDVCQTHANITVTVANTPSVTITALSDSICPGTALQLFANVSPVLNYTVDPVNFAPDAGMGTEINLPEDALSSSLPIGFNFRFYGSYYNQFYVSSNGFITFDPAATDGCCEGQVLPSVATPNNLIAFAWEDLSPQQGGSISYYTTGTAPNRKLVIRFDSILHYAINGGSDPVTAQIQLYEGSNIIEIHTTSMPGNPSGLWLSHTMGIENAEGTQGIAVLGRNGNNSWTASSDAWRFSPSDYVYSWTPADSFNNANVPDPFITPYSSGTYHLYVIDSNTQCADTGSFQIELITQPEAGVITPAFEAFCDAGFDTLQVTGYSEGSAIQWMQSGISGGPYTIIPGATGDDFVTPLLDTATYYIASVTCGSTLLTGEATLEVQPIPEPPKADTVTRCGTGPVTFTSAGNAGSVLWYDAATEGNYLGEGNPFTTQPINQSTTFWAAAGPVPADTLVTEFNGNQVEAGNMFSITAAQSLVITGFEGHLNAGETADIECFYKEGDYEGFENDASAWQLIGATDGISGLGNGSPTPYPIAMEITLPAGKTFSFYLTSKMPNINHSEGTLQGNIFAMDENLAVKEGVAISYPFGDFTAPVQWNGIIHYHVIGCTSERAPFYAMVYFPQIAATATNATICRGDTAFLQAENYGPGDYNYQWLPLLPGMIPPDGMGNSVKVVPENTLIFTLTATGNAGDCDTAILVPLNVLPLPVASFSGLPDTVALNDAPYLLTGNPPGGQFSGTGVTGNIFDPFLAGVGGPYPVTYSFTDSAGCFDDSTRTTVVILGTGWQTLISENQMQIFPNPSDGNFEVHGHIAAKPHAVLITVKDYSGRSVYSYTIENPGQVWSQEIDFTGKTKGMFIVEINADGMVFRRKLVIQ